MENNNTYRYRFLSWLIGRERRVKRLIQISSDAFAVWFALGIAYSALLVRPGIGAIAASGVLATLVVLLLMFHYGAYKAIVRYIRASFLLRLVGISICTALFVKLSLSLLGQPTSQRFIVDFLILLILALSLPRWLIRWAVESLLYSGQQSAIIYGAGAAGRQLVSAIQSSSEYHALAFVDDDRSLTGATIMGLPVLPPESLGQFASNAGIQVVLLAVPSATPARRKEILQLLEPLGLRVQSIPGLADLASGQSSISQLHDVPVTDLLGRDSVQPDPNLISADTSGKSVLVTGAGGSIGSELCRQVLEQSPSHLVLYEHNEYALYALEQELSANIVQQKKACVLVAVLGSVRDGARLTAACRSHSVNTVYHAAAYKHVPLVEHNPLAGVSNNFCGTWVAVNSVIQTNVDNFVLVSTDKAVNPTNVMGASKRLAELAVQAMACRDGNNTRFSIVRFGNVLASSGSVVPKFKAQLALGGPITVTHADIIRYFMTIPEAAQLVIQAGALGGRGEVFVLDMGDPVRIVDLAARMVRLSGLRPKYSAEEEGDIEIRITGLRPGEKLYEELLINDDDQSTSHPKIRVSSEPKLSYDEILILHAEIESCLVKADLVQLRRLLLDSPAGWQPKTEQLIDLGVEPAA